jgi:hypothetical protein
MNAPTVPAVRKKTPIAVHRTPTMRLARRALTDPTSWGAVDRACVSLKPLDKTPAAFEAPIVGESVPT